MSLPAITSAVLSKLHNGVSEIKIIEIPASPTSAADYDFSSGKPLFTKSGTFEITTDDDTTTEQKLDQNDQVYDTVVEGGKSELKGFFPGISEEVFELFLSKTDSTTRSFKIDSSSAADYSGKGFDMGTKTFELALCVMSQDKKTGLIFTRVKLSGKLGSNDKERGINFVGTILNSGKDGIATVYPVNEIDG